MKNNLKDLDLHTEKKFRKQEVCIETPEDQKMFYLQTEIKVTFRSKYFAFVVFSQDASNSLMPFLIADERGRALEI